MAILTAEFWGKLLDRATRILEKQGFAIFFGVWALWAASWVGTEVVIPVRDAHVKFLDRLATSTETSAESVQRIELKLDRACRVLENTLGYRPEE